MFVDNINKNKNKNNNNNNNNNYNNKKQKQKNNIENMYLASRHVLVFAVHKQAQKCMTAAAACTGRCCLTSFLACAMLTQASL